MQNLATVKRLVAGITLDGPLQGWRVVVHHPAANMYTLQVRFTSPCSTTGVVCEQSGRKWLLSRYMTDSEVIQTAFLAVKTAMEHEVRESFKWHGEPVLRPHYDIRALHTLSANNIVERRPDGIQASNQQSVDSQQHPA